MPEYIELLILFGVGLLAGLLNVLAGGGSSITLPVLIFLGLDGSVANGTNRVAILLQNIFATASYHKQKVTRLRMSMTLATLTLPGAIIGALAATRISNEWFERILGVVLIAIIISMFLPQNKFSGDTLSEEGDKNWLVYPAMFAIGFYGGFIQVGVGFLIMAALYHLLKMNLVFVNIHKVFIILLYTIPALLIFIFTGNVDWKFGLSLAAGNALGGYGAAHLSLKHGVEFIRYALIIAILVMAAKLLGLF